LSLPSAAGRLKLSLPGLAGRLALVTGALVTLAVASMLFVGVRSLRSQAEAEALTRVKLGASAAREGLRQATEDVLTAARILGERPPLQRLLRGAIRDALPPYLTRYCESAALDACAIVQNGEPIASTVSDVDWKTVIVAEAEQGERFLVTGAAPQTTLAGASAAVTEHEGVSVLAVRRMNERLAERLSERAGVEVRIIDYASFVPGQGPLAVLNSDALSRGEPVAAYIGALGSYAASLPVAASTGETVALLQALLPADKVLGPVGRSTSRMLIVAILIAALATASAVFIGRYWISAVEGLTEAARRLGSGDLATSIPVGGGKELSVLGNTLDEMRRNLVDLTGELRRRETEAQAVLGGIIEGVYAVDEQRRIRFVNPQAERLLKVSASQVTGAFCGDVLKPLRDASGRRPCEYACPIIQARRDGSARAVEQVVLGADESVRRVVIASAAPADGIQVQVLRDETELEAVRRTRDTVLANISHEFRTPLAAQLASIELLSEGIGKMDEGGQRQLVSSLQRGTQRLTWLIDNLLESVRIEAGQLGIRKQDVLFDDVIGAAQDLIGPLLEQRRQKIMLALAPDVPVIRGDQQRLTQVLVNLLANASKFGPVDSTITIGARAAADGGLDFWVEDEGPGPKDPDDTALFEQFHRSGGEDPEESGLGLGLFIVRSIVERHGGTVSLGRTNERTHAAVHLPKEPPQ
ncbi:MAG TPA: ATP-binding protein, partial [Gammaproteobacteria bacterium]|nr:ATP-binding protein [Gammaproteobacteria bacterium]